MARRSFWARLLGGSHRHRYSSRSGTRVAANLFRRRTRPTRRRRRTYR